jgi:hypothetical protein
MAPWPSAALAQLQLRTHGADPDQPAALGYCGTAPSRPTLMRAASNVPSAFLLAASTV